MRDFVIEGKGIKKSYTLGDHTTPVLHGLDIVVDKGECLFLAGPSGSGKSTLLSILGCILSADEGELTILGRDIRTMDDKKKAHFRRDKIGFVFQKFHLFRGLRAWENVCVSMELLGYSRSAAKKESFRLLDMVGLSHRSSHHVNKLSLGQCQRVALARALAGNPEIIFADEPTASLDFESGHNAMKILRELAKQLGCTVVVVTHDFRIYPLADRILTMENGKFVMVRMNTPDGKPGQVLRLT